MALLATAWGARLTFNFWRRGGYAWPPWSGVEDYRWAVLRAHPLLAGPWRWRLFNLGFVSLYQVLLLLLITLPSVAAAGAARPLNLLDAGAAGLFIAFLLLETAADQQQYEFQQEKHRRRAAGEPLDADMARGFRTTGLFALARHPNFAAEQAIWCAFYLFGVAATGQWLNWSIIGAVLLILLFQGSTQFTEKISLGKYPEYAEYRRRRAAIHSPAVGTPPACSRRRPLRFSPSPGPACGSRWRPRRSRSVAAAGSPSASRGCR